MSTKELIDELLLEVSFYHPIPNFKDKEHLDTLIMVCEQKGYAHLIPSLKEAFLGEEEPKKKDSEQSQAQKLGLVHLGRGFYGKKEGEPATHKSDNGKIRVLKPGEAPGGEKEKPTDATKPSAKEPPKDKQSKPTEPTASAQSEEDEENDTEDLHKAAKETPQAVLNDPKAPARLVAIARAQLTKNNVAARREKEEADLDGRRKNPDGFDPVDPSEILQNFPDAKSDIFVGKSELSQKQGTEELEKFNTDIAQLADLVQTAKEKGEGAPDVNLCQVSIPGTNLYCDDNKGIPREQMPQFKGKPAQGSKAAEMETDRNGEVDTEPMFKQMMAEKGIKTLQSEVPADKLKATQSELVGAKVVSMYDALENNPDHPEITAPVYVSRDGYVVDGHHRWAAVVAYNAKHPLAQIPMRVNVIDSDIKDVIPMANQFAQEIGVAVKKASPTEPDAVAPPTKQKTEPTSKSTEPTKKTPQVVQQEPEEKGSESDKLNTAYGKGKASDIKPKEQPKVKDKAGDTAKTDDGKVLYSVGGGYYSDTPGGIPKYIRVESVVEKAISEDSTYWWGMLFNEAVTAKTKKGTIKVEPITNKSEQEKAAIDAKKAREADAQKSEEESKVEEFDVEKIDKSAANADYEKIKSSDNEKITKKLEDNKNRFANELDKLPDAAPKEELKSAMDTLFEGGELTPEQQEICKKWVRVVEPGPSEPGMFKVYVAQKEGNFRRSGKAPASKIEYGGSGLSKIIRDQFIVSGLSTIPTSVYGGKKTTPNRVFSDKKTGKTKLMGPPAKVDRGADGKLKSVSVHGYELKPVDENESGISKEEKKKRQRTNRNLEEIAKAISKGTFKSIDMDEGVKPDTPEGRTVNIKSSISKMASSLKELAGKYGAEDNPIVEEMEKFASRDPNDKPEEWFKDMQSIFSKLANDASDPSLKEAWPNYAEMYNAIIEMHDNGKGTQNGAFVILPESTTLENVDLISIKVNDPKKRIVSVEGKSVKAGEGGAGNIGGAIKGTQFKNDPSGKFKKNLQTYFSLRDEAYKMRVEAPDDSNADKYHKEFMKEQADIMKKLESDSVSQLGYDAKKFAKLKKAINTPGTSEYKAVESATKYVMELRKKKGMGVDKLTQEKIKARLQYYYAWGTTTHEIYNDNVDVQDFVNDSIRAQSKTLAKDGKVNRVSSDGMNVIAFKEFEYNIGFAENGKSSNPGAGRFHNMSREEYEAKHNESVNLDSIKKLPKAIKERILSRLKEASQR